MLFSRNLQLSDLTHFGHPPATNKDIHEKNNSFVNGNPSSHEQTLENITLDVICAAICHSRPCVFGCRRKKTSVENVHVISLASHLIPTPGDYTGTQHNANHTHRESVVDPESA